MKLLSLNKLMLVERNIIVMSDTNQDDEIEDNENLVGALDEYLVLNSNELISYGLDNYKIGDHCHIKNINDDYVFKMIYKNITIVELSE